MVFPLQFIQYFFNGNQLKQFTLKPEKVSVSCNCSSELYVLRYLTLMCYQLIIPLIFFGTLFSKKTFFLTKFSTKISDVFIRKKIFLAKKKEFFLPKSFFSLMKTSDIFVENLVNKKLLPAAFYHLTYQHDSKDFNICNYKKNFI